MNNIFCFAYVCVCARVIFTSIYFHEKKEEKNTLYLYGPMNKIATMHVHCTKRDSEHKFQKKETNQMRKYKEMRQPKNYTIK